VTTEDEVRRAVAVLDTQRAQLESLARQEELLQLSLEEYMRAKETVSRYREAGKDAEILVPVGAGAFLIAQVKEDSKALINIGSDIVFEEGVDKATERLEERIKQLEEASKSLGERVVDMDNRVKVQTSFVQDLYDKLEKESSGARGGQ
jgi:prefoldin alpha subunit